MIKLIPVQYRIVAIVAVILAWTFFSINHGKKLERAKWIEAKLETTEEVIKEANKDIESNRDTAKEVETIIKYKDRIVYETITKTIQAECPDGAAELTGLLNLAIEATNDTMLIHSD